MGKVLYKVEQVNGNGTIIRSLVGNREQAEDAAGAEAVNVADREGKWHVLLFGMLTTVERIICR